jgi:hypothetical protein
MMNEKYSATHVDTPADPTDEATGGMNIAGALQCGIWACREVADNCAKFPYDEAMRASVTNYRAAADVLEQVLRPKDLSPEAGEAQSANAIPTPPDAETKVLSDPHVPAARGKMHQ